MKKLFLFFVSLLSAGIISAQTVSPEVIASSGGSHGNAAASVSWTLGECLTETFSGSGAIINQGLQQGYLTVTAIEEITGEEYGFDIYPVPADNYINLKINGGYDIDLNIILSDLSGNMLIMQSVAEPASMINLESLPPAEYILQITDNKGRLIKSFSIIKH
jgi:hypothetical protein